MLGPATLLLVSPTPVLAQAGGGTNIGQYIQYVVIAVVLLSGAVSWAYQQLVIQRQKQRERSAQEHRAEEYLRTGRDPGAPDTAASQQAPQRAPAPPGLPGSDEDRLRELARKRQEQLRRQGAPTSAPRPAPAPSGSGPITRELWPGGPVIVLDTRPLGPHTPHTSAPPATPKPVSTSSVPAPSRQGQPAAPQRPAQRTQAGPIRPQASTPAQRAAQSRKQAETNATARAERDRAGVAARKAVQQARKAAQDLEAASETDAYATPSAGGLTLAPRLGARSGAVMMPQGAPGTLSQWRAAIIAAEVLAPPLSLR